MASLCIPFQHNPLSLPSMLGLLLEVFFYMKDGQYLPILDFDVMKCQLNPFPQDGNLLPLHLALFLSVSGAPRVGTSHLFERCFLNRFFEVEYGYTSKSTLGVCVNISFPVSSIRIISSNFTTPSCWSIMCISNAIT